MQSQLMKTIIHNILQFIVKVIFLKINFDIIKHVEIAVNALILMFIVFHFLNCRIKFICFSYQFEKSN